MNVLPLLVTDVPAAYIEHWLFCSVVAEPRPLVVSVVFPVLSHNPMVAAVRTVKQFLTFAGGTPLQHAAAAALSLPEDAIAELVSLLRGKRDRLAAGLRAAGFDVLPTAATYFLNADGTPLGEPDATALCERLPEEAGVVAIPTSAFAADPAGGTGSLVRFAFPKGDELLDEAIARLGRWAAARPA